MRDSKKPLSKLDFKFHFYPWWGSQEYILEPSAPIPPDLAKYFEELKINHGINLSEGQKAWYVAKKATQLDSMLSEFPSVPEEAFNSSILGAYYSNELARAKHQGRICNIPYDENTVVHTAWDLGFGDSTAIWFFQICGKEIHVIDYHEDSQRALPDYLKLVKGKTILWALNWLPMISVSMSLVPDILWQELAARHWINFIKVPDVGLCEGIDAVRLLFPRIWFDEQKCELGLKALHAYRRQWNDKSGIWGAKPFHNGASKRI